MPSLFRSHHCFSFFLFVSLLYLNSLLLHISAHGEPIGDFLPTSDLTRSDWIDPGDMFSYDHSKMTNIHDDSQKVDQDKELCQCPVAESHSEPKEKQLVNDCEKIAYSTLLRIIAKFKKFTTISSSYNETAFDFAKYNGMFARLGRVINQTNCAAYFYDFDIFVAEFISSIHSKNDDGDVLSSWSFTPNHLQIIFCAVFSYSLGFFFYTFKKHRKTFALLLLLGCCFIMEWYNLYQKKVSEQVENYEKDQKCQKLGWSSKIFNFFRPAFSFRPDSCEKNSAGIHLNAFFDVNPATALVVTFDKFLTFPLRLFGKSLGVAVESFFQHIPDFYVLPFMIIFAITIIFCIWTASNTYIALKKQTREVPFEGRSGSSLKRLPQHLKFCNKTPNKRLTLVRCLSEGNLLES